jgi:hypothetical protein
MRALGSKLAVTLLQSAYSDLDPEAQALVERLAAELEGEPLETVTMFRYLVAMVAVKRGDLREVKRGELNGKHIVVLVDEESEAVYQVEDVMLGEAEAGLVNEMAGVLGG